MKLPPLGLYIHLPWCEKKCPYCDFNSHAADAIPEQRYVDRLLDDLRAEEPLRQGRTINTIFIGGGTPSLFSPEAIARLLEGVADSMPLSTTAEITLEANPGSAESDNFQGFAEGGVTRLSLGIQSFDDSCLDALGRVHDSIQAHAAIRFAREAGFHSFNIDLMHGLPGQTPEMARSDLAAAIDHAPPHLSWYQLTIEPNTVFYSRPPTLPGEDNLADIQSAGEALLAEQGYGQYEVSAYSRPGLQCRHNINYWHFGDYLGIGAGAHGKVTYGDGRIQRYAKTRQPDAYMASNADTARADTHWLDSADIPGEYVMNALRMNEGFSLDAFTARTGLPEQRLHAQLERLRGKGLLEVETGRVVTTALGRRFLDSVVTEFLA